MIPPLCFSSLGCPDFTVEQLCLFARQEGIPMVEIRSLEGTGEFTLLLADQPDKLRQSRELLQRYGIEVRILGSSFCLTTQTREGLDSLVREGRVADELSVPYLRIFGGGGPTEKLTPERIRQAVRLYRETQARFSDEGIRSRLIIETHGGFTNSGAILQFCHEAGDSVRLLWDTHHTWKIGGESLADTFSRIQPLVQHFHVKDSVSLPGDTLAHRYVLPGQGEFPFAELFALLERGSAQGAISLEWERKWHPELPPLGEAVAAWKQILPGNYSVQQIE